MTNVIMFNDSSNKSLYLLDYLVEQGYNPKVVDVNVATTLEECFSKLTNDGTKVFLQYTYEDLKEDHEKLRQEIQGLESKGWRNLIVLPFEGMDDKTIELRVQDLGLKFVHKLNIPGDKPPEPYNEPYKPYVEVPGKPNRVQEQLKDVKETVIEPKTNEEIPEDFVENKGTKWQDNAVIGTKTFHVGKDDVRQIIDTAPNPVAVADYDTSIDLSKLPEDKNAFGKLADKLKEEQKKQSKRRVR
jgi:hypothetical protein